MQKQLFGLTVLAVLALGAGCSGAPEVADTDTSASETDSNAAAGTVEEGSGLVVDAADNIIDEGSETDADEATIQEFTVTGDNFAFAPNTMTVKKGDTVRITFVNAEGFHDLRIDEYDVATQKIQGGASEVVEFVADKAGSFEYYCSVGSHRQMGMVGTLTVTE